MDNDLKYSEQEVQALLKVHNDHIEKVHKVQLVARTFVAALSGTLISFLMVVGGMPAGILLGAVITTFIFYTLDHTMYQIRDWVIARSQNKEKKDDNDDSSNDRETDS